MKNQTAETRDQLLTVAARKAVRSVTGFVVYSGESMLDQASPVIGVLTMKSANDKTGNMAQLFIIREDIAPLKAIKAALDKAICGTCPHIQSRGGACYVNVGQSVSTVYRTYLRGRYIDINQAFDFNGLLIPAEYIKAALAELLVNRKIRFGAYGDPAALPIAVLEWLASVCAGFTGYTHQLRNRNVSEAVCRFVMVSVDTAKQALKMQAKGLRYFRVKRPDEPLLENEASCPASDEAGKLMQCIECGLCDGTRENDTRPSMVINVHGIAKGRFLQLKKA